MDVIPSSGPFDDGPFDFAALLEESFGKESSIIQRGDILNGTILAVDQYGIIIDLGKKRDGVVPRSEMETLLSRGFSIDIGQEVTVMITHTEDRDGNMVVSMLQALSSVDWQAAQDLMDRDECYEGHIVAANKGGLIVPFGELRGFVPASHIVDLPRGLADDDRLDRLSEFVGKALSLKIIEVNPQRRRLVLSQRNTQTERREEAKARLLDQLKEGDVVEGRVSSLRDFGAFIDLGGADGLIHISELAWRRIHHPSEVLKLGQDVKAFVLQLDHKGQRIGLSLKRLEPNPWEIIEKTYQIGQVVEGNVSRVVSFGAFIELENGIEALLHVSEMAETAPEDPSEVVTPGQTVHAQIISLEPERQRMGLSLKSQSERLQEIEEAVTEVNALT